MDKKPFISIITPVKDAEKTIDRVIEGILKLDYPRKNMEFLISDGGSKDRTRDIIKKWQEKYEFIIFVDAENSASPSMARREALKHARGEYFFFLDGDCVPHKDWVERLLDPFFMDPGVGMAGGEIYTLKTGKSSDTENYCEQTRLLAVGDRCEKREGGIYPPIRKKYPSEVNGSATSPHWSVPPWWRP